MNSAFLSVLSPPQHHEGILALLTAFLISSLASDSIRSSDTRPEAPEREARYMAATLADFYRLIILIFRILHILIIGCAAV